MHSDAITCFRGHLAHRWRWYALRSWIGNRLHNLLGIAIHEEVNRVRRKDDRIISTPESRVAVCVIPTNEELLMARYASKFAK